MVEREADPSSPPSLAPRQQSLNLDILSLSHTYTHTRQCRVRHTLFAGGAEEVVGDSQPCVRVRSHTRGVQSHNWSVPLMSLSHTQAHTTRVLFENSLSDRFQVRPNSLSLSPKGALEFGLKRAGEIMTPISKVSLYLRFVCSLIPSSLSLPLPPPL